MSYQGDGVALSLFGLEIRWYAVFIVTGMILAIWLSSREAQRRGIDSENISDLALVMLPVAIVGARVWYVLFEWNNRYAQNPILIFDIRGGGLAIHGGIIASLIVGAVFCKKRKLPFFRMADIIFPYVALAQGIGRWGNFTNNEAFGGPTDLPWALIIDGQKVHPTFLYESIGDVLICLLLIWFTRKKLRVDGQVAMWYLIGYGILRFFVEGLRTDSLMLGGLRVAQLISCAGILAGIAGLVLLSRRPPHSPDEDAPIQ
ncbi:MAG: prolipoprotein diacylglyceryl transferase [Ndongobacter sp.]|nr:prolipoprotein diacylglyceryl transferase [Ndongobacter sp.]